MHPSAWLSSPPPSPQTQNRRFHLDFLLLPLLPGYDRHVCRSGAKAASTSSSSSSPSSWVIHSIKGETASFPHTDAGGRRRRRDLDDSSAKKSPIWTEGEKKSRIRKVNACVDELSHTFVGDSLAGEICADDKKEETSPESSSLWICIPAERRRRRRRKDLRKEITRKREKEEDRNQTREGDKGKEEKGVLEKEQQLSREGKASSPSSLSLSP